MNDLKTLEAEARKLNTPKAWDRYFVALDQAGFLIPLKSLMDFHPDSDARNWVGSYNNIVRAWQACENPNWLMWVLCAADQPGYSPRIRQITAEVTSLLFRKILNHRSQLMKNLNINKQAPALVAALSKGLGSPQNLIIILQHLDNAKRNIVTQGAVNSFLMAALEKSKNFQVGTPEYEYSQIGIIGLMAANDALAPSLSAGRSYTPMKALENCLKALTKLESLEGRTLETSWLAKLIKNFVPLPVKAR